jgi:hypothetical protein
MHGLVIFCRNEPKASAAHRGAVSVEVRLAGRDGEYRRRDWI